MHAVNNLLAPTALVITNTTGMRLNRMRYFEESATESTLREFSRVSFIRSAVTFAMSFCSQRVQKTMKECVRSSGCCIGFDRMPHSKVLIVGPQLAIRTDQQFSFNLFSELRTARTPSRLTQPRRQARAPPTVQPSDLASLINCGSFSYFLD